MSDFFRHLSQIVSSDTALFLWKTLATIATAGFGIYGLDAKSRDEKGNFSKQGKVVLTGLLISALITGLIQAGEFMESQRSAAEQLARSRRVLLSIERNLYPLE